MSRALASHRLDREETRGITTVVAAILLVIILVLVGVTSFALLGGFNKNNGSFSCEPKNSPTCGVFENLHDISLLLPFQSVQQNTSVPFTATLPSGEVTSQYTFNFGDDNATPSVSTIAHHSYTNPGQYVVSVTANVAGLVHDNFHDLVVVAVTPSYTATTAGTTPTVQGTITGNSTVSTQSATAVVQPGQWVGINGSYTANPTNPQFVPFAPSLRTPTGATVSNLANSSLSLSAHVSFGAAGIYPVTFVAGATKTVNGVTTTAYENYTWTIFVADHASVARTASHTSPHSGTILAYELAPGGAYSEDPAIDYETVGYEPILNVYQTLIQYNGSQTGPTWASYVPVLATCVPGSPQCQHLYGGDSLINGTDYTFVIQRNASFYDPTTGASWGVYPTDVLFSLARTLGFSTLPCVTCNNGWILAQSLLSHGNGTWSSIHGAFNNTPQRVYASMTINGSECPPGATTQDHGCVTFHVDGNNKPWPYFLELIADGLGGSIVSCGWFSAPAQAAGIPYWTQGNVSDPGDHPCGEPGSAGWGLGPTGTPALGWDHWEQLGSGTFGTYQGHVQFNMLGSGPYYMAQYQAGSSYVLKANPSYGQNPYCTWDGCQPAPGQYANTIEVTWENDPTPGEQAYVAGQADFASVPSTDFSLLLQLISQGKVNAVTGPTLTIGFYPFDMNFNLQASQRFATSQISVPTNFFSYVGMRAYFATAYPYQTVQNTIDTVRGVQLGFLSGGAIPQFMANYYPSDIPWPNQDPCSDNQNPACPTYWWDQMQQVGGPYYDPQVAGCSASSPCEFPLFGTTGSPALDETNALWVSRLASYSNGGIKADPLDIDFAELIGNSEFTGPGQNPMPLYSLGWAPDYPDPTDYVNPLYLPNATYTYGDAVEQSLLQAGFAGGTNCPVGGNPGQSSAASAAANSSSETFYANNVVNSTCQGNAYQAMLRLLNDAAFETNLTLRAALYDEAEKIAFHLYLYVYTGQGNALQAGAAWVDTSSFNRNVTIGGGGDHTWYLLTGKDLQYPGST